MDATLFIFACTLVGLIIGLGVAVAIGSWINYRRERKVWVTWFRGQ